MTAEAEKKNWCDRRLRPRAGEQWPRVRARAAGWAALAAWACFLVAATGPALTHPAANCAHARDLARAATAGEDRSARVNVGFVTGHGEPSLDEELSGAAGALRRSFTVTEVRLSEGAAALDGVDVVIVAGGPDIPDHELYVLDQFLMRGGRMAFLMDAAEIPRTGTQANISQANIFGFLGVYGIIVNPDLVLDSACADAADWGNVSTTSPYFYWPVVGPDGISDTHPAVAGFTRVPMAWTSSISTQSVLSRTSKTATLLRSSPDSWTVSAFADLGQEQDFAPPERLDDVHRVAGDRGFPLAVAIEGTFRSAFAGQQVIVQKGRDVEFVEPEGMLETSVATRVVVFGASTMFRDDLATQLPGSAELLASVVDWLAADDANLASAGAGGSTPAREWTPRRLALVMLALASLAAAVAASARFALTRRKRPSSTE